ncbi:MAG: hypothetical protein ACRYFL_13055 [Janthinobacterium lividum]
MRIKISYIMMLSFKTNTDFYGIKEVSMTNWTLNNGIIFTVKKNPQNRLNEKRFAVAGINPTSTNLQFRQII